MQEVDGFADQQNLEKKEQNRMITAQSKPTKQLIEGLKTTVYKEKTGMDQIDIYVCDWVWMSVPCGPGPW